MSVSSHEPCPHTLPDGRLLTAVLAEVGGVDPANAHLLSCHDVHEMIRVVGRNNYLAHSSRDLVNEVMPDAPEASPRTELHPRLYVLLIAGTVVLVLLGCSMVARGMLGA
jgi:hypothetical protein